MRASRTGTFTATATVWLAALVETPSPEEDWPDTGYLVTYVATGAVLTVLVFVISAVSAPMIFDRGGSARRALMTSIKVVARNPLPMALRAALIATLAVIGLATFMAGLV